MATIVRAFVRALLLLIAATLAAPAVALYVCNVAGGGSINFLVYNPAAGSPALASADITLRCTHLFGATQRIDWTMELSNGGSGNCNARTLAGPGSTLGYNIFQTTIANGIWGNAGCGTYPAGHLTVGPGLGNRTRSVTNTLYGQIPTGQFVSAGTYNDTLLLTIVYN